MIEPPVEMTLHKFVLRGGNATEQWPSRDICMSRRSTVTEVDDESATR